MPAKLFGGVGSPEGAVSAPIDSIYHLSDGSVYQKQLGDFGASGWILLARAPSLTVRKDADQNGFGTIADVSGLTVAVLAGQRIRFRAYLLVTTSNTAAAGLASCNGPAASLISYLLREWSSATVQTVTMKAAFDSVSANINGPGSSVVMYEIIGMCKFLASGVFAIRARAGSGIMSVLEGSWMEYDLQ